MSAELKINSFVQSEENDLGMGRLRSMHEGKATVEYYCSPADSDCVEDVVSEDSLFSRRLANSTRVYYRNEETDELEIGRVLEYHEREDEYFVSFPNDSKRMLPSHVLNARCSKPIKEPTDHLAKLVNETAFWYQGRTAFVKHLLDQQRISAGLTALFSSAIEIVPHQVEVIQEILNDPFQRYLLADEVGLGKTIEAGIILKQLVLDEPRSHQTVIIVPEAILAQWKQELINRFHLGSYLDKTIHLITSRNKPALQSRLKTARMVIIDEAHHLSSWAWSSDHEEKSIFNCVAESLKDVRRHVLLLSATPVRHNEDSFLAMLHLLDPEVYSLDDLDSFKKRVALRQSIAECLSDLREDESNGFIEDALRELGEILNDDKEFMSLQGALLSLVENDVDEQDADRNHLIRVIRTHLAEMWQLHRRILRSRRDDKAADYMPGRKGDCLYAYDCEVENGLLEAIDNYRVSLSLRLDPADTLARAEAGSFLQDMEEAASSEPRQARKLAEDRLEQISQSSKADSDDEEVDSLKQIARIAKDCDQAARLDKLLELVVEKFNDLPVAIFTSEPITADLVAEFLREKFDENRVVRYSTTGINRLAERTKDEHLILVCDKAAEEGLNLNAWASDIIHYDLPYSPNRIEQRIGRLDRFGSIVPVTSWVLLCRSSKCQIEWYGFLNKTLNVFSESVTKLQYVIDDATSEISAKFLDTGSEAFAEVQRRLDGPVGEDGSIKREKEAIRSQDALDSLACIKDQEFKVSDLADKDLELEQVSEVIFDSWLLENLHFSKKKISERVFKVQFTRRVDSGGRPFGADTLVPLDVCERLFKGVIDDGPTMPPVAMSTVPLTCRRASAQKHDCHLLRVGNPFVSALQEFISWDDRGVSYAFWRYLPSKQTEEISKLFFKFDYIVSANPEPLRILCKQYIGANLQAVVRRTNSIMHPRVETIWLDADLNRLDPNAKALHLLESPFSKQSNRGKDFNLNRLRWEAVAQCEDMSVWADHCAEARNRSEQLLLAGTQVENNTSRYIGRINEEFAITEQQFKSRLALSDLTYHRMIERDYQFEKDLRASQLEAIQNPYVRVDSVGAIYVANFIPFSEEED
jgi:ATP-dependent helicase HepA